MRKSIFSFLFIILLTACLGTVSVLGLDLGVAKIPPIEEGVKLGLDLVGGSSIVFEADSDTELTSEELSEGMEIARQILVTRLYDNNYTEATVTKSGTNRLRVEIPSIENPEEAVELLGSTARLEFRDADGNVILYGSDIKEAAAKSGYVDATSYENYVELTFEPEAVEKFAAATEAAAARASEGKNYIAIYLDDVLQSQPYCDEKISSEICIIRMPGSTQEEVIQTASLINAGQMPFALKQVELSSVGPTLGERSLQTSLLAGGIGLILVMIFMIACYRLPGIIADIALIFYTVVVCLLLSVLGVNLSLPGIAGIILSIGMAVDADVVIFERIKEELRSGKTVRSAIDSGFKRAFTAILDANVTTVIAAAVLLWKGTGVISSFAVTLIIGVVVSMVSVLFVCRFLLSSLVGLGIKGTKVYGV